MNRARAARAARTVAATFMVAALAASCGTTDEESLPSDSTTSVVAADAVDDDTPEQEGVESGVVHEWEGVVNLGPLEFGGGDGSAAAAGAERIGPIDLVGPEWFGYGQPVEVTESCRFGEVRASVRRSYLNGLSGESIGISIDVYESAAEAEAGLALVLGPEFKPCAEDSVEQVRATVLEAGIYDDVESNLSDGLATSLLPERGGATRRYKVRASGAQATLELDVMATAYVVGQALVGIEVALLDDDHAEVTAAAATLVDWDEFEWTPDPEIDDAVDRLRTSILGPESPARFYNLFQPGVVEAPSDFDCNGPPAGLAEISGPTWATQQGISAIFQSGLAFATEAEAEAAAATLAEVNPICIYEETRSSLAGTTTYEGAEVVIVERDGVEVTVVQIAISQRLDGSNAIDVEAAYDVAVVQSGTDVIIWRFLGVRGDEPDLAQLAVDAKAKLAAGS